MEQRITNKKIVNNAKWILICKVAEAILRMVVGMLSARYLGPSNFGLINYASNLTALFIPIMTLGLQSTLVQEYVDRENCDGAVMGTALAMNGCSALACMVGMASFVMAANWGEWETVLVCVLYSCSLLFQGIEMLQYWFQAKLLSKYSSGAMLAAYVAMSCYKLILLISGRSIYWFAVTTAVEYAVAGGLLLLAYRKVGQQKLRFDFGLVKELFSKSRHYIIAMLMVVVYCNLGGVLLKLMVSESANGYFATAVSCVNITGFALHAIIDTARPVVLESLHRSNNEFEANVSRVYSIILVLTILQAVFFTVFAEIIIRLLYGQEYMPAVPVLRILVWQVPFSFTGVVRNIWILGKQNHRVLGIINLFGACLSVLLNLVLIPLWGACGAALSAVLIQAGVNFFISYAIPSVRHNNRLVLRSLSPRFLLDTGKMLLKNWR